MQPHPEPKSLLDLSRSTVGAHWNDVGLTSAIETMEACEPWAIDRPGPHNAEAERLIEAIAARLSAASPEQIMAAVQKSPGEIVDLLGFLHSGRAIYLFRWLADVHPSVSAALIQDARFGGKDFGQVMLLRLNVLQKQHILFRIFSPERLTYIERILVEAGFSEGASHA